MAAPSDKNISVKDKINKYKALEIGKKNCVT